jgi:sugar lactone lactonase YvrE
MVVISSRTTRLLCALALACMTVSSAIAQDTLFQSRQITPSGEYTFGIEGPAVDARGNLYIVNFGKPGTIGKVAAGASQSELFGVLPEGSVGVTIRFDREGRMFVADYKKHNIFLVSPDGKDVKTYFHSDDFNQPNDLTVAADGTIYASDPHWKQHDGQIWRISKSAGGETIGEKMTADRPMSTTNGIDLSPTARRFM